MYDYADDTQLLFNISRGDQLKTSYGIDFEMNNTQIGMLGSDTAVQSLQRRQPIVNFNYCNAVHGCCLNYESKRRVQVVYNA